MIKKVLCVSSLAIAGVTYLSAQTSIEWHSDMDFAQMPKLADGSDLPTGFNVLLISAGADLLAPRPGPTFELDFAQSILENHAVISTAVWDADIAGPGMGGFYNDETINAYTGIGAAAQRAYMFMYDSLELVPSSNWIIVTNPAWVLPPIPDVATPGPNFNLGQPGLEIIIGQPGSILAANPIPEPSTYALFFGLGILGFLGYRRFRK